jgi:hypothetical protein
MLHSVELNFKKWNKARNELFLLLSVVHKGASEEQAPILGQ